MIKKVFALMVLTAFTLGSLAYAPAGKRMNRPNPQMRGGLKTFMFFKAVKNSREKLNLTEKQNVQLDKILRDVEAYTEKIKEEKRKDTFAERFVSDSFDPFKIEEEQKRKKEEIKNFYLSKIKAVHDLLTKEQRQILVDIMKEKVKNMRKARKIKGIRKWREKRMKMQNPTPKNY